MSRDTKKKSYFVTNNNYRMIKKKDENNEKPIKKTNKLLSIAIIDQLYIS